jgi:hypothetical protein
MTGLANDGSHGVAIKGFLNNGLIVNVQWTPYLLRPGGVISGEQLPLRDLPADIEAHQQIRLVITFRKPPCQPGTIADADALLIQWHALGVDHEYKMPLGPHGSRLRWMSHSLK